MKHVYNNPDVIESGHDVVVTLRFKMHGFSETGALIAAEDYLTMFNTSHVHKVWGRDIRVELK